MPRRIAYDVLCEVIGRKKPLDEAFNAHPQLERLSPNERAFARAMVHVTLRNKGLLDHLIDPCLEKKPKGRMRDMLNILRLALAQFSFMNVPAYAAIDEANRLCIQTKFTQYRKLVNAVLRRIEREKKTFSLDERARLNTPNWLYESWVEAYGDETALKIARAHLEDPDLDLTLKHADEADIWAKRLDGEVIAPHSVRLETYGRIEELDGFDNGSWWVQDQAASLPVTLLGDVQGLKILDLCSAPGGKTLQLAARGAEVIAIDKSKNRLKRVEENLARTKLQAEILSANLLEWEPAAPVDGILLDAPCSATGTLRRHPDGLWIKRPSDIKALCDIQGKLWHRASLWVKPGGVIVYCTCSLQPEEGELMLKAFLKGHKNFEIMGEPLRTFPFEGRDGFFAVAVKRMD